MGRIQILCRLSPAEIGLCAQHQCSLECTLKCFSGCSEIEICPNTNSLLPSWKYLQLATSCPAVQGGAKLSTILGLINFGL